MASNPLIGTHQQSETTSPPTQSAPRADADNSSYSTSHTNLHDNNSVHIEESDEGTCAKDLLALLSQSEDDDAAAEIMNGDRMLPPTDAASAPFFCEKEAPAVDEANEAEVGADDLLDELLMLVDDDNNDDFTAADLLNQSASSTIESDPIGSQHDMMSRASTSLANTDSVGVRRTLLSFGKSNNNGAAADGGAGTEAARALMNSSAPPRLLHVTPSTLDNNNGSVSVTPQPQRISGFGFASGSGGSIPQYRSSGGLPPTVGSSSLSHQEQQQQQQPARFQSTTAPASTQRVSGGGFQAIGLCNASVGGDDGDDGGPNSSSLPLPFHGKPFILCPRSRIRFVPTHQRSVQNFIANEFEAVTSRQLPYKEIASVNKEHTSASATSPPSSSSSAFSVVGVVVSKYYPRGSGGGGGLYSVAGNGGDSDETANSSSGEVGAGGATYGIVKVWDLRGTSLHTGANSSNPNILTLLVGGAAFVANFSRLVPGTVIIVLGPTLSKSKGGGGVGSSSAQKMMPMFRVSEMSSLLIAGRAVDCVPCAATTNGGANSSFSGGRGGGGGGPYGGGLLSFKKSGGGGGSSGMGERQCTVLVNKAVSEFCTFHAAGAASRLMRQAMASSSSMQSQNQSQTQLTTVTTHTTGVTTARLKSLSTPFALTSSSGNPVGAFSANAAALKVAGSVGATAALNPLFTFGGGESGSSAANRASAVASNLGPARNVMLRPPSSAPPTSASSSAASSSVVGELKALLSANSKEKGGVRASASTATRASMTEQHKQMSAMSLKQSLQAQLSGILGIGVTATATAGFAPPPQRIVDEKVKAVPSSAVVSSSALGTANATFNLLKSVGDDDPRSGETSPRGRWRALVMTSPAAHQPQPQPPRDSALSKSEDFICTKGGKIVNQQTQRLAGIGDGGDGMSSATRELLRHRMEPKEAMSGHIGMTALLPHTTRAPPPPVPSSFSASGVQNSSSSLNDVAGGASRLPLAQHSRIPSHFTGLGSSGGINVSTPAVTTVATTSAVAATAALGGPRGRMMLAAAVDAQTKAKMKQQLDEAKRMTIVVKEATKRAREGEEGDARMSGEVVAVDVDVTRFEQPQQQQAGRAQLLSEYKFGGDSPVPSTFFVRKGASATAAAQDALRQQILAGSTISQQQQTQQQLQQAAALGLPAGVRVLNPTHQAPSSSAPSHGSRAFAPLSGSGGSATFVGGGGVGGAARSAQRTLVQTAGESAFVASALAVASGNSSGDTKTAAGHSANANLLVSLAKKTASRHSEALSAEEWDAKLTTVDKIVRAEKALEALDRIFEVPDVPCAYCEECERYFANSVMLDSCRRAGHTVRRTTAVRRFYECADCSKYRIQVLEPPSDATSGSSVGASSAHTSIVQGSAAVINTNTQKRTEGRRRVLDRDCGVCKRLGTWRRCSAAPVPKGDSLFER